MVNKCISQYIIVAGQLSEGQSVLLRWCIWWRRIFSRAPHDGVGRRIGVTALKVGSLLNKKSEHVRKE